MLRLSPELSVHSGSSVGECYKYSSGRSAGIRCYGGAQWRAPPEKSSQVSFTSDRLGRLTRRSSLIHSGLGTEFGDCGGREAGTLPDSPGPLAPRSSFDPPPPLSALSFLLLLLRLLFFFKDTKNRTSNIRSNPTIQNLGRWRSVKSRERSSRSFGEMDAFPRR